MQTTFKARLSNLSIWIIVVTIAVILLWLVAFIVMQVFDLKVFASKSTEFFYFMMLFAMILVACAAGLNIALNISIIADSKLQDMQISDYKKFNLRFFLGFAGACAVVVISLFIGDFLSQQSAKKRIILEARDVIDRYHASIDRISEGISDKNKITAIPEVLGFLASQKSDMTVVLLILKSEYDGQQVFLEISRYSSAASLGKPYLGYSFYKCDKGDAEYLKKFFGGKTTEPYYRSDDSKFLLYYPIRNKDSQFVLLFTQYDRYGKIGS